MPGNMFQIANQTDLGAARVAFRTVFMQQLQLIEDDPIGKIWTRMESDTEVESYHWLGDIPGFEKWRGDRRLAELVADSFRVKNEDWADGFRVHQNNFKDDKLGLFPISIQMLALNAAMHRFDIAAQLLVNGFDGLAFPEMGNGLAYDGAFLFSNSHASLGGPPQSNYLGRAPLTMANLEAADVRLRRMKTADGKKPLRLRGTHLIVGPQLINFAKALLEKDVIANAAGTAAETNNNKGRWQILESAWIDGAQGFNWFLADLSKPIKPVIFQMREEISTSAIIGNQGGENDSVPRFERGEIWFGAEARYTVAPFAWQTIIGANPPVPTSSTSSSN